MENFNPYEELDDEVKIEDNDSPKQEEQTEEQKEKPKKERKAFKIKMSKSLVAFMISFITIFLLGMITFATDFAVEKNKKYIETLKLEVAIKDEIKTLNQQVLNKEKTNDFKSSFRIEPLQQNLIDSNENVKCFDGKIYYAPKLVEMNNFKITDVFTVMELPNAKIEFIKTSRNNQKARLEKFDLNDIYKHNNTYIINGQELTNTANIQTSSVYSDYHIQITSPDRKKLNRYKLILNRDDLTLIQKQKDNSLEADVIGVFPKATFIKEELEDDDKLLEALNKRIWEGAAKIEKTDYIYIKRYDNNYPEELKYESLTSKKARVDKGGYFINTVSEIRVSSKYAQHTEDYDYIFYDDEDNEIVRFKAQKDKYLSSQDALYFCDANGREVQKWIEKLDKVVSLKLGSEQVFANWYYEGQSNKLEAANLTEHIKITESRIIKPYVINKTYKAHFYKSKEAYEDYKMTKSDASAPKEIILDSLNVNKKQLKDLKYTYETEEYFGKYKRLIHWYNPGNENVNALELVSKVVDKDLIFIPKIEAATLYIFKANGVTIDKLTTPKYYLTAGGSSEKVLEFAYVKNKFKTECRELDDKFGLKFFVDASNQKFESNIETTENPSNDVKEVIYYARWNRLPYEIVFKMNTNQGPKEVKVSQTFLRDKLENNKVVKLNQTDVTEIINIQPDKVLKGYYFNNPNLEFNIEEDSVAKIDVALDIKEYDIRIHYATRNIGTLVKKEELIHINFGELLTSKLDDTILNKFKDFRSYNYKGIFTEKEELKKGSLHYEENGKGFDLTKITDASELYDFYLKNNHLLTNNRCDVYVRYEKMTKFEIGFAQDSASVYLAYDVDVDGRLNLQQVVEFLKSNNKYHLMPEDEMFYGLYLEDTFINQVDFESFVVNENKIKLHLRYLKPLTIKFYNGETIATATQLTQDVKVYINNAEVENHKLSDENFKILNENNELNHVRVFYSQIPSYTDKVVQVGNTLFPTISPDFAGKTVKALLYWRYYVYKITYKIPGYDSFVFEQKEEGMGGVASAQVWERDKNELEEIFYNVDDNYYALGISKIDNDALKDKIEIKRFKNNEFVVDTEAVSFKFRFVNQSTATSLSPIFYEKTYKEGDALSNASENSFEFIANNLFTRGNKTHTITTNNFDKWITNNDIVEQQFPGFSLSERKGVFNFARYRKTSSAAISKSTTDRNVFNVTIIRPESQKNKIDVKFHRFIHDVVSIPSNNLASLSFSGNNYLGTKEEKKDYSFISTYASGDILKHLQSGVSGSPIAIDGVYYLFRYATIRTNTNETSAITGEYDINNLNTGTINLSNKTYIAGFDSDYEETLEIYLFFYRQITVKYEYADKIYNLKTFPGKELKTSDFQQEVNKHKYYAIDPTGGLSTTEQANTVTSFSIKTSFNVSTYTIPADTTSTELAVTLTLGKRLIFLSAEYEKPDTTSTFIEKIKTPQKTLFAPAGFDVLLNNDINYLAIVSDEFSNLKTKDISNIIRQTDTEFEIVYQLKQVEVVFKNSALYEYVNINPTGATYHIPLGIKYSAIIKPIPVAKYLSTEEVVSVYTGSGSDLFDFNELATGVSITLQPKFVHKIQLTFIDEITDQTFEIINHTPRVPYKTKTYSDGFHQELGKVKRYKYGPSNTSINPGVDIITDKDTIVYVIFEKPRYLDIKIDGYTIAEHPYLMDSERVRFRKIVAKPYYKDDQIDIESAPLFDANFELLNIAPEDLSLLEPVLGNDYLFNLKKESIPSSNDYLIKLNIKTKYLLAIRHYMHIDDTQVMQKDTTQYVNYKQKTQITPNSYTSYIKGPFYNLTLQYEYRFVKFNGIKLVDNDIINSQHLISLRENRLDIHYFPKDKGEVKIDYFYIKPDVEETDGNVRVVSNYDHMGTISLPNEVAIGETFKASDNLTRIPSYSEYMHDDIELNVNFSYWNSPNYNEGQMPHTRLLRLAVFFKKRKTSQIKFYFKEYIDNNETGQIKQYIVKHQDNLDLFKVFDVKPDDEYAFWKIAGFNNTNQSAGMFDKLAKFTSNYPNTLYVIFNKVHIVRFQNYQGEKIKVGGKYFSKYAAQDDGFATISDFQDPKFENAIPAEEHAAEYVGFSKTPDSNVPIDENTAFEHNIVIYLVCKYKYRVDFIVNSGSDSTNIKTSQHYNNIDHEGKNFIKKEFFQEIYSYNFYNNDAITLTSEQYYNAPLLKDASGFTPDGESKTHYYITDSVFDIISPSNITLTKTSDILYITKDKIKENINNQYVNVDNIPVIAFTEKVLVLIRLNDDMLIYTTYYDYFNKDQYMYFDYKETKTLFSYLKDKYPRGWKNAQPVYKKNTRWYDARDEFEFKTKKSTKSLSRTQDVLNLTTDGEIKFFKQ